MPITMFPTQAVTVPMAQSPSVVVANIEAAIAHHGLGQFFSDRIVGSASSDRIVLRRRRAWGRNDGAPVFRGQIRADGRAIEGHFGASTYLRVFLGFWFAMLLLLMLPTEVVAIARDGWTGTNQQAGVILAGLLIVGGAFPRIGWMFCQSDIAKITALLERAAVGPGA